MTIAEEALYAFIREGCAQKGEGYSREDFRMFKTEHYEDFDDELVQMKCALKAAGVACTD
jgi:hypothetical protein